MKKSRFMEEEKIKTVKSQEAGEKTDDGCCDLAMSQQACYKWNSGLGSLDVCEVQKLCALKDENRRLKQILAEQALNIRATNFFLEKNLRPEGKREPITSPFEVFDLSEPRASKIVGLDRSPYR